MGEAQRAVGTGQVHLTGMFSLEPFTIQALGSPEVFQTGETYQQAPLIDYQHPHDLIMGLGVGYDFTIRSARGSSRSMPSARQRSARRRSCTAHQRRRIQRRPSRITCSIRPTSPRA